MEEITTTAAIGAAVSFSMKAKSTTITAPSSRLALPSVFGDADSGPDESDLASSAGHGEHIEAIVDPTELLFCREEGGRLAERGEFEQALSLWNKALRVTPNDHFLLEMKCQALLSLGFFVKAASVAAQVISLAPSWAEGQLTFARVQRELGEVEIAIVGYKTALRLDPDLVHTISEEYEEMNKMSALLEARQQQQQSTLKEVSDKEEAEVVRCFMNLNSRAQVG